MKKSAETFSTLQLQQVDLDERPSRVEQELVRAAEARHRLRLLHDERTRLEDLAGEWIELLHANSCKTTG